MNLRRLLALLYAAIFASIVEARAGDAAARIEEDVSFAFILYFPQTPSKDFDKELSGLVAADAIRLQLEGGPEKQGALGKVVARWAPSSEIPLIPADSFSYFAVGLDPSSREKFAAGERVLVLEFSSSLRGTLITNRNAAHLAGELAKRTGAAIWDDETRQLFSPDKWHEIRVETWQENLPLMSSHVTMHAYRNPELIRVITLGMRKFGLPDLVMTEIQPNVSRSAANTINAVMQAMIEGARPESDELRLELSALRHATAREHAMMNPQAGAQGKARLALRESKPEEGDPRNLLLQLDFPEAEFQTATERQQWGFAQLFGSSDSIKNIQSGDPEMAAASERARKAFFAQEERFRRGLAPGEHLLIKAGFKAADQTEFMWVEVTKWKKDAIEGILSSDPYYVKKLRAGMRVTVALADVYDYILYKPDGSEEGNETGKVLLSRGR